MSEGGDVDWERAGRATRISEDLLSIVLGASAGDLNLAIAQVTLEDGLEVLGTTLRRLAGLVAALQLREFDVARHRGGAGR